MFTDMPVVRRMCMPRPLATTVFWPLLRLIVLGVVVCGTAVSLGQPVVAQPSPIRAAATDPQAPTRPLPRPSPPRRATPVFHQYFCGNQSASRVDRLLREILPPGEETVLVVDPSSNSILVRGSRPVQTAVREFLRSLQEPGREPASATAVVRAYPVPATALASTLTRLRAQYARRTAVRITGDVATGRMFVLAPARVQQEIAAALQLPTGAGFAGTSVRHFLPLPPTEYDAIQHRVLRLFTGRLQTQRKKDRDVFVIPIRSGSLTIDFDRAQGGLVISGPPRAST